MVHDDVVYNNTCCLTTVVYNTMMNPDSYDITARKPPIFSRGRTSIAVLHPDLVKRHVSSFTSSAGIAHGRVDVVQSSGVPYESFWSWHVWSSTVVRFIGPSAVRCIPDSCELLFILELRVLLV